MNDFCKNIIILIFLQTFCSELNGSSIYKSEDLSRAFDAIQRYRVQKLCFWQSPVPVWCLRKLRMEMETLINAQTEQDHVNTSVFIT